jgi:hypothetical protein
MTTRGLPRAKLLQIRPTGSVRWRPLYARCANCAVLYWLGLEIVWRMPWIRWVADRLYGDKP